MARKRNALTEKDMHKEFKRKLGLENKHGCVESAKYDNEPYQFHALVFLSVKRFMAEPKCSLKNTDEVWMWVCGIAGGLIPVEVNAKTETSVDSARYHWNDGKKRKENELDLITDFLPRANQKKIQRLTREKVKVKFLKSTQAGNIDITTTIKPTRMPADIQSALLPISLDFS